MEVYRTTTNKLTERLDPTHYHPELLARESLVKAVGWAPFSDWVAASGIGHTAAVTPHFASADEAGVPFVSGAAIKSGTVDVSSSERVRVSSHRGVMAASKLVPGMLVAVRKGSLGNAGILPPSVEQANCSSEVMFFHLNDKEQAGYLSSYFNGQYGRAAFKRQQRGMMIPSISLYDVPDIVVPSPDVLAQRYIGSKVRQAEALRAAAHQWLQTVENKLAEVCSTVVSFGRVTLGKVSRVPANSLSDRLDASFYAPDQLANHQALRVLGATPLGDLVDKDWCNYGVLPSSGEYVPSDEGIGLVRGGDLEHGQINEPSVFAPELYATKRGVVRSDDVLILAKGACIDGTAGVGLALAEHAGKLFNGSCYRVRTREVEPAYLAAFCRTNEFLMQKRRAMANTGTAYNSEDAIHSFLVVVPSVVVQEQVGRLFRQAITASGFARRLVLSARLLVEALIERKVSEADLITAAQNPDADRALLARLRTDGLDGDGDPLFADLNALTELLAEAANGGDA
jgi:type I restriction enzyme, S subunit